MGKDEIVKTMTLNEAKNQGYKYAMIENGEGELIPLDKCSVLKRYTLASKDSFPFTISEDIIRDLVDDYLCSQDEVSDDDGHLNELAAKVDYSEIAKKLNEAFACTKYFYSTDIKLVI